MNPIELFVLFMCVMFGVIMLAKMLDNGSEQLAREAKQDAKLLVEEAEHELLFVAQQRFADYSKLGQRATVLQVQQNLIDAGYETKLTVVGIDEVYHFGVQSSNPNSVTIEATKGRLQKSVTVW